ncbi:MAG: hypothetical protein ACO1OB_28135 [Archangium sp.]
METRALRARLETLQDELKTVRGTSIDDEVAVLEQEFVKLTARQAELTEKKQALRGNWRRRPPSSPWRVSSSRALAARSRSSSTSALSSRPPPTRRSCDASALGELEYRWSSRTCW